MRTRRRAKLKIEVENSHHLQWTARDSGYRFRNKTAEVTMRKLPTITVNERGRFAITYWRQRTDRGETADVVDASETASDEEILGISSRASL